MKTRYDYIICGAGCAGLSLAYYLSLSGQKNLKVLILDKDSKSKNDRTWCFWQKGDSPFDGIVDVSWNQLQFYSDTLSKKLAAHPYSYKKIRGIDFYEFVLKHLEQYPNFTFKNEEIIEVSEDTDEAIVKTSSAEYFSKIALVSFAQNLDFSHDHHVLQHFKGWEIETTAPSFDKDTATFMDFRTDQKGETRFLYVLPTTESKALVELAVFSNEILSQEDYDKVLKKYIKETLNISEYKIEEEEFGVIPMSTFPFEKKNKSNIKYIGTAGGWVKASSGFAFERIQRMSKHLAEALSEEKNIDKVLMSVGNRYRFYDRVFLNVILTNKKSGADVFTALFKSLQPDLVFKFLDEDTSFLEDLKLFTGPPTWPFIKGFFSELT